MNHELLQQIELIPVLTCFPNYKPMKTHSHGFLEKPNYKWDV